MEIIEIPFGAKDSELQEWTYTIPGGMEAEIKDGKVIIKKKESEDERISLRPQPKDEIYKEKNEKPKHTEVWVEGRTIFEQDANTFVNPGGEPEAKLIGWVARDREYNPYFGLGLVLFNEKPKRTGNCWSGEIASQLPWRLFPDLKWEDEPIEVEITIKRK